MAVVPAAAFTIEPNLSAAQLTPIPLTAHGWACSSWFDLSVGQWLSECEEISIQTTVSASFVATGGAEVVPSHQVDRDSGDPGFRYRITVTDTTVSRPATATATAFGHTASDPTWARIARQSSTNISITWSVEGE